jgi:hypothetical protein
MKLKLDENLSRHLGTPNERSAIPIHARHDLWRNNPIQRKVPIDREYRLYFDPAQSRQFGT